ncbi:NfrA family protein [Vibrio vulnificus]|uniref:NfrA family protein n=2 Tax=Vibrio vulnificus TaxID=672 RepID=UPI003EDB0C81
MLRNQTRVFFCSMAFIFSSSVYSSERVKTESVYDGLSDAQHFRTYPYIDKAFRLEARGDHRAAIEEVEKALNVTPGHVPYRRYALQLGYKAELSPQELKALINQLPAEESQAEIYKYRFTLVQKGEPLSVHEFKQLTQGMSQSQSETLYLQSLYAIEKHRGANQALAWSSDQPDTFKTTPVYRFEAYQWFEQKQYQRVLPSIKSLANQDNHTLEDMRYLLLSLIYLGRDDDALRLVEQQNSLELEVVYLRYTAEREINNQLLAKAKEKLVKLATITSLTSAEKAQLSYINALDDNALREAKFARAMPQCLRNVLLLNQEQGCQAAQVAFHQCDPNDSQSNWMNVAVAIDSYQALEKTEFSVEHLEQKRRRILVDYYSQKNEWRSIITLLDAPRSKKELESLALAYNQLHRYSNSAKTWLAVYKLDNDLRYIDMAAYNAALAHEVKLEAQAYQQAMRNSADALERDDALINRAASLVYKDITLFTVDEVNFLAHAHVGVISPAVWAEQKQCATLLSREDSNSYFLFKAAAFCYKDDNLDLAVVTLENAMKHESSDEDHLLLADWYYQDRNYSLAVKHWQQVNKEIPTRQAADNYIDALLKTQDFQAAETQWYHYENKLDARWWQLGIESAYLQNNKELAESRVKAAFEQTKSMEFAVGLAKVYLTAQRHADLHQLVDDVLERDSSGQASAQLGYFLSEQEPQLALPLLENAATKEAFKSDPLLWAQYAFVSAREGKKHVAKSIYAAAIDNISLTEDEKDYFQRAHRDIEAGWKFFVAGWIGDSKGVGIQGYAYRSGDFFMVEEGKYYFDNEYFATSALRISASHNGQFASDTESWNSNEFDLGVELKPWEDHNYFFKFGIKQGFGSDSNETRPYIWLSGDVLSNDDWSKRWQNENDSWLYQQLYVDGIYYFNGDQDYSLYGRYDLGYVFKVFPTHKQRMIPYGFVQKSLGDSEQGKLKDFRAGIGISWAWDWKKDHYDGYAVNSEVGIEWQHIIENNNFVSSGNSILLRFSSYF